MAQDIALTAAHHDYSAVIVDLQERINILEVQLKKKKKTTSNPAVVGLAGFGITTFLLQFHNFDPELMTLTPIVWLGMVCGGFAQLVAGFQEFSSGNNFAYSAFTTYGAFWISLALLLLGDHAKVITMGKNDLGFFLIGFTLYSFIMLIATMGINFALFTAFLLLQIGIILLDLANFDKANHVGYRRAAGSILLVCALVAWYVMAHIIYLDVFGKNVLPVGPAPKELISKYLAYRKRAKRNDKHDNCRALLGHS